LFAEAVRRFGSVRAFVPSDGQSFAALYGGPGIFSDNDDTTCCERSFRDRGNLENAVHTRNCFGFGGVKLRRLATENRAARDDGVEQSRRARIDAEFCTTCGFQSVFDAMRFVASGQIKPVVGKVLPLRELARAQDLMETNAIAGKIAMVPPGA